MPDEIDELLRSTRDAELPPDVERRLRSRLSEFRIKVEDRPAKRSPGIGYFLLVPSIRRLAAMSAVLLLAVAASLVVLPRNSRANQMFTAAAAQLRNSQSLAYTIVLNDRPYVAVDFTYSAPGRRRIACSWGIEVRTDGTTGKQLVLMHGIRAYLNESGKTVESESAVNDFSAQLRSLPNRADDFLGEHWNGRQKLLGFRLRKAPPNGGIPGLKAEDIWIDAGTGDVDHVDITVQEPGKPEHQMHIRHIVAGQPVDPSVFELTPPAGYRDMMAANASQPVIQQTAEMTAVVVPMKGPHSQTSVALSSVEACLKQRGTTPLGPPFGRYWSEARWETGYPAEAGTQVEAPFQVVTVPAGLTASVVAKGKWGTESEARWGSFLKSVLAQGYVPAGPAMEIWSGEDGQGTQSTEMRIPVIKAK